MSTKYRWLPHLEDAVPSAGQGKRISTYTVSLEGWRRGLQLKFYSVFEDGNKLKVRYSLSNGDKTHHFSLSMGDKVSKKAFDICADKELTKQYLRNYGVPVPEGKMFEEDADDKEIIEYGLSLGFPIVVKPTDGNAGKGVFANIQSEEELREIVPYVRKELEFSNVIVEKYVSGEEFRIYVIEDRVLGAMNRRPASVVGDGIHTIRELISENNKVRKINPHLTSRLIRVDKEIEFMLEEKGYDLNSIPAEGERVFLREKSNLSTGGDAIDVTDQLTPEIEKIAIDCGKAIPGLSHYGVDMIVSDDRKHGVILEVNSRPGLGGHLFPGEGKARDFAKEIIDYYFPETKDGERTDLYFDFDSVLEPLVSRTASNVDLIKPPLGKLYGEKWLLTLNQEGQNFRQFVRRQANKYKIHGHLELLNDDHYTIVVASVDPQALTKLKEKISNEFSIEMIDCQEWNKPLKMGFEIKNEYKLTRSEIKNLIKNVSQLERENERLQKRYDQIRKSRAWRATSPVRIVLHTIKKLFRAIRNKNSD